MKEKLNGLLLERIKELKYAKDVTYNNDFARECEEKIETLEKFREALFGF